MHIYLRKFLPLLISLSSSLHPSIPPSPLHPSIPPSIIPLSRRFILYFLRAKAANNKCFIRENFHPYTWAKLHL